MREAMPFHRELSDDYFMSTPLLTKVGKLTGDRRYFDMALKHIRFLETRVRREDGLYRHSPLVDAAWSRANSFPALGLAMALVISLNHIQATRAAGHLPVAHAGLACASGH